MKEIDEIEEMSEKAAEEKSNPKLHGMTYEDGVDAALNWVLDYDTEGELF